jgi:hypothetical protein
MRCGTGGVWDWWDVGLVGCGTNVDYRDSLLEGTVRDHLQSMSMSCNLTEFAQVTYE